MSNYFYIEIGERIVSEKERINTSNKVTITFVVEHCRDDCPFCKHYKDTDQWFCSALMGSPVNSPYTIIESKDTEPLKFCPYR